MQYVQANMLLRKFSICLFHVKTALFKAYFTPMFTGQLWRHYRKSSIHNLQVNDGMRMLLKGQQWSSASQIIVNVSVPTCAAMFENLMYSIG